MKIPSFRPRLVLLVTSPVQEPLQSCLELLSLRSDQGVRASVPGARDRDQYRYFCYLRVSDDFCLFAPFLTLLVGGWGRSKVSKADRVGPE